MNMAPGVQAPSEAANIVLEALKLDICAKSYIHIILTSDSCDRVATQSGNQGKQGKWPKQIPCREKSGNFKI